MIARLKGRLVTRTPTRLVLDIGGVGYAVHIPLSTFYNLPAEGAEAILEIHTHVREDGITLFGFSTESEKRLFERLIGVSGIGPKLACTLLSGLAPVEIIAAVRSGEPGRLVRVPGIGRKTAERIVLELRDGLSGFEDGETGPPRGEPVGESPEDAVSALTNLGYKVEVARRAVRRAAGRIEPAAGLESLLREALRTLST